MSKLVSQVCDGYSKVTLMGNWYEERIAKEQKIREDPDARYMRTQEQGISFVTHDNQIKSLPRTKRCPPWETKAIIPDDNYREFRSLTKTNYDIDNLNNFYKLKDCRSLIKTNGPRVKHVENNPYVVQTYASKDYKLLNTNNFVNELAIPRHVGKRRTDFGSTLRRHDETHERLYGMTQYQRNHSRPLKQVAQNIINNCQNKSKQFSGINFRKEEGQGNKILSALTGEYFKRDGDPFEHGQGDPKDNTQVQRNWIPNYDKAIKVADFNINYNQTTNERTFSGKNAKMGNYRQNISQKLPYDISTSIPMGNGEYARRDKYRGTGNFRKIRTDVTMVRNKTFATR